MELAFGFYNLLLNSLGYGAFVLLRSRMKDDRRFWEGRAGKYEPEFSSRDRTRTPRIWLHAASVGEAAGILPTVALLRDRLPDAGVYLTTGTVHGYRFAQKQAEGKATVLPFPMDFPHVLRRAFRTLRPDLYVATESEFWPNLFQELRSRRIPALLLNGHLSAKSTKRYKALGPLFLPIFRQFRRLAMHSPEDRQNALELGAAPERTIVLGTAKYDGLSMRVRPEAVESWRNLLGISSDSPVVVGGSLRGRECAELLGVFLELRSSNPNVTGIFAPRHLHRVSEMAEWLRRHDLPFQLLSDIEGNGRQRTAPVVLVDRIGILFDLYALGDLVFCGGSIEPVGGHNILEPAAWGKAVFHGPHVEKVYQERRRLEAWKANFPVRDAADLLAQWRYWAGDPAGLKEHGERAREAVRSLEGVAARQVDLILKTLSETSSETGSRLPIGYA